MSDWKKYLKQDSTQWLLEPDSPGVRYLALRDLVGLHQDDPEFLNARKAAHTSGPIARILEKMQEEGYWEVPGAGYLPKYTSTVWSLIMLAQLGAHPAEDERIERACTYLLDHALAPGGQISASGAPSGTADCMQGNLCWALMELGCRDPRLDKALDWMARSVTGEGIAPMEEKKAEVRYYGGKCGPNFACGSNNKLPCAWGGAKVMLALGRIPPGRCTPGIESAIRQGEAFFFSVDPASAGYPNGWAEKPSQNWWKFGFPVFYVTDLLQVVEAMTQLGYGQDPRLSNAFKLILEKQDAGGRWLLEYDYNGKTWVETGEKKRPDKWVTLRVCRVLKAAFG